MLLKYVKTVVVLQWWLIHIQLLHEYSKRIFSDVM